MRTLFLVLIMAATAMSQTTVSQSFLDDANAAFKELPALRIANAALIGQVAAEKEAKEAYALAARTLTRQNDLLLADNADLRKLKCDSSSYFFVLRFKRCK